MQKYFVKFLQGYLLGGGGSRPYLADVFCSLRYGKHHFFSDSTTKVPPLDLNSSFFVNCFPFTELFDLKKNVCAQCLSCNKQYYVNILFNNSDSYSC